MSFWQSQNWKKLILNAHQAQKTFLIDDILVEKRSIWLWKYWLFALWIWEKQKINEKKIIELCKRENALFVQIETFWVDRKINLELKNFHSWYYKKFITPYTAYIDLTKTSDEILAEMKPKWRYNIKLAAKKWVEVFEAEKTSKNVEIFYNLMLQTTSRDDFSGNTLNYYKTFLQEVTSSRLLLAKKDDEIIAGWIFVFEKDISIYYYWASTSQKQYRNLMAPYLLQWEAIKIAQEMGSKIYDFLWIASPEEENSPLAWVTDFKLKLTPNIKEVSKSYIYIHKKLSYKIFLIIRKIKSIF